MATKAISGNYSLMLIGCALAYLLIPTTFAPLIVFFFILLLCERVNADLGFMAHRSIWLALLFFLIVPTLFIDIQEIVRRLLYILPIFFVLANSKPTTTKRIVRHIAPLAILIYLLLRAFLFVGKVYSPLILTTLGLGYDNSHHFAMFQAVLHTDQISRYSLNGTWAIPSWFAQHYPFGNQIVWGSLLAPLRLQNSSIEESIALFALSIVASLIGIVLIFSNLIAKCCESGSQNLVRLIIGLTSIVLTFGSFGYIVVSGFPPVLTACLLLGGLLLIGGERYSRLGSVIQILCVALIALTYVTLTVPAGLALTFLKIAEIRRGDLVQKQKELWILGATSLLTLMITQKIFAVTAGDMGWRQILADGGIERIPASVIWSSILVSVFFVIISFRRTTHMKAVAVLLVVCWLIYLAISALTEHYNGYISYYAQKQGYIVLAFTVIAVIVILIEAFRSKNLVLRIGGIGLFGLFGLFQFSHSTDPKDFTSGFMSSVPISIEKIYNADSRKQLTINGPQLIEAHRLTQHATMTLVLNSNKDIDLTSRWMNAINHTWTNESWFFYNEVSKWYENPEVFADLVDSSRSPIVISDNTSEIETELKDFLFAMGFNFLDVARK